MPLLFKVLRDSTRDAVQNCLINRFKQTGNGIFYHLMISKSAKGSTSHVISGTPLVLRNYILIIISTQNIVLYALLYLLSWKMDFIYLKKYINALGATVWFELWRERENEIYCLRFSYFLTFNVLLTFLSSLKHSKFDMNL